MLGTSNSGSTISRPASGPKAWAVATPRLSSTTGDGLIRARPSYSAVIRSQSVSSGDRGPRMAGGDRRLQGIRTDGAAEPLDRVDVRQAALNQQAVPPGAVLVEQQHRRAVRSGARPQPRGLELHQRKQAERLGVGTASARPASGPAAAPRRTGRLRNHWSPLVAE